jgi:hypothetical protein
MEGISLQICFRRSWRPFRQRYPAIDCFIPVRIAAASAIREGQIFYNSFTFRSGLPCIQFISGGVMFRAHLPVAALRGHL